MSVRLIQHEKACHCLEKLFHRIDAIISLELKSNHAVLFFTSLIGHEHKKWNSSAHESSIEKRDGRKRTRLSMTDKI
jgi:hypothetical protein